MTRDLPNEIWIKIYRYSAIVNNERRLLLNSIRKYKLKKEIENAYKNIWGDDHSVWLSWLDNDFCLWLNNQMGTLYCISDKLKNFYKREFELAIMSHEDLDKFENGKSSSYLWNLYYDRLTYEELNDFVRYELCNIDSKTEFYSILN